MIRGGLWRSLNNNVTFPRKFYSVKKSRIRSNNIMNHNNQKPPPAYSAKSNTSKVKDPNSDVLIEGSAKLYIPPENRSFYNNVQVVNRDLSIVVLETFLKQLKLERVVKETNRTEGKKGWRKDVETWSSWGKPPPLTVVAEPPASSSSSSSSSNNKSNKKKQEEEEEVVVVVNEEEEAGEISTKSSSNNNKKPYESNVNNPIRILEALAASGLRSIRYGKELDHTIEKTITTNDLQKDAFESIKTNVKSNEPYPPGTLLEPNHDDAINIMTLKRFDVIDLDPYGSPSKFVNSALRGIEDGGLLCVTATDLAVMAGGNNVEKCHAKYGSIPLHRAYSHEMAIRTVLANLETHANIYGKHIVPLLSLKIDFYVRVFVRVYTSALEMRKSVGRLAYVLQSRGCDSFFVVPMVEQKDDFSQPTRLANFIPGLKCEETDLDYMIGGPMWSAPIHNQAFIKEALELLRVYDPSKSAIKLTYAERIAGLLAAANSELPNVPLYYVVSSLAKTLHCSAPPMQKLQAAIVNAGYAVSQSDHDPEAIKTDAAPHVVWDIMRCWVAKHPISETRLTKDSMAAKILAKKPQLVADFDPPASVREARKKGNRTSTVDVFRPRFFPNPEEHWGPKQRNTRTAATLAVTGNSAKKQQEEDGGDNHNKKQKL